MVTDGPEHAAERALEIAAATHPDVDLSNLDAAVGDPAVGRELVPIVRAVPDPADEVRRSDVDRWGRSEHFRELTRRAFDPIYKYWFRVEWEGFEHLPEEGGALLVANHAGAIPPDAPSIMHGIEKDLGRPVYGLAENLFRTMPVVGTLWSRSGGVAAHPDNAYRLLHDEERLVLVFPEGTKGTGKHYRDRYRLRRFGRGGFVDIAMRAGVPVIPIAVMGAEETAPREDAQRPVLPGHRQHARVRSRGPGRLPAGEVPYPGAPAGLLRRAAESGAVFAKPCHGRVGTHPAHGAGRALRHAPHTPKRVVRLNG
jgi:1-acyl-sn-glycerol-3-phosphate acyltransferase